MTSTTAQRILLGAGLLGFGFLGLSVYTQKPLFTYLAFFLLALGFVGSFVRVSAKWGEYTCFWFIKAYDDKHMPIHIHGHANVFMLLMTLLLAYAAIAQVRLPGFPGLTPYYFWMFLACGITLILMVVANARSFPEWMSILNYNRRKD